MTRYTYDGDETHYMGYIIPPPPVMPGAHRRKLNPWLWPAILGFIILLCCGGCSLFIADFLEQFRRVT